MNVVFTRSRLKSLRFIWYCLTLIIVLAFFACDTGKKEEKPSASGPETIVEVKETPPDTEKEEEEENDDEGEDEKEEEDNEKDDDEEEAGNKDEVEPIPVVEAGQNPVLCGGQELATRMMALAREHTGVLYSSTDRTTQCSGIFQRVLGSVRRDCPEAEGKTPPVNQIDSRGQGKWYYEKNALTLIKDPIAQAELIRPGAVMFYGKLSQEYYNTNPVEKLWERETGIRHVGVVVEVERNEAGDIESYSLFHGRTPGTTSGISNADNYMHRRVAKENAPSFGNGPDPWVGVAPMVLQE